MKGNVGECQGNVRVEAKCWETQGNAGECRGIQGNARGTYGSGCKVPGECWGMQGNARETYGSGCKLPGECRDCRGMPGNIWEWVYSARGMQVTTRVLQGSGCKELAE